MLQHDPQGFLIGEVIPDIRRQTEILTGIRADIAEIRRIVKANGGQLPLGSGNPPQLGPAAEETLGGGPGLQNNSSPGSNTAEPNPRGERANRAGAAGGDGDGPALPPTSDQPPASPNGRRLRRSRTNQENPDSEPRSRDSRGRFSSNEEGETNAQRSFFNGLIDRFAEAVTVDTGLEDVDPTVKAFNEVAQPLARSWEVLAGGDKDDQRWFRRIFSELKLFRRDETVFNRAANRSLRNLEDRPPGNGGDEGSSSFFGGFFGSVVGKITAIFTTIGTALLAVSTTVIGAIFSPIGLAIGGLATAAWGLFTEDGRKFFANVADKIYAGWYQATDYIKGKWDDGVKVFSDLWEPIAKFFEDKFGIVSNAAKTVVNKVSETAEKANDFVKDKTGIDVKESAHKAYEKVSESVSKNIVEPAGDAYKKTAEFAKKNVIEPAGKAFANAKDWVLGQTSKFFESGKGGSGTVSSGKGDFGGASYGTYQLSSKQGTLQNFLKSSGYGAQFEGLTPGTKAFNRRWKEIAQNDPTFGAAQHDFIKQTHFDPQVERLKKAGIDISGRGKAVQDAVWSTSVQFGGDTSLIEKALRGKEASKLSDAEVISAIQDYKIANNDRLFRKSSSKVKAGTLDRAQNEKSKLLSLASIESSLATMPKIEAAQSVSAPSPAMPSLPKPTVIAEAPQIQMPIASDADRQRLTVSVEQGDVGQDIRDRKIALIATGGLSG
jgi:hypothetical protein